MKTYTIKLTDDQADMIEKVVPDVEEWLIGAITGKLNNCLKRLTAEHTMFNPARMTHDEMITELKKHNIKSRKERDKEELTNGNI